MYVFLTFVDTCNTLCLFFSWMSANKCAEMLLNVTIFNLILAIVIHLLNVWGHGNITFTITCQLLCTNKDGISFIISMQC